MVKKKGVTDGRKVQEAAQKGRDKNHPRRISFEKQWRV
jgi:hypothetical protein